jgi:hypothetical protein
MEPGFVEVTTSYSPLGVFYALVKTTIEIDDTFRRRPWGTHRFEVEPGEHTVAISFPWVFDRRCGRSRVTVTVRAGETTHIAYRIGPIRFLPGKITIDDPIPAARVVKPG